jgi:5-bromo-4-chloroindolyl phosphate hydrolysis protein
MKDRTDEIKEVIEKGNKYIEKIHDSNVIIKDKYVTRQLDKMETIVSTIFHEVDVNPSQADSLGMFLNYYLPTTEKLLDAYITIGEKQVTGKNLSKTQKEIEESLETIIVAFENILEKMYEAHEMDIASDIAAMEIMMKQEGLTTEE